MSVRSFITGPAVVAVLCFLWSFAAPWAAAFPARPDHYKVTLFGVRHIADMSAAAAKTSCTWNDADETCRPAPGADDNYRSLSNARWFMLAAFVLASVGALAMKGSDDSLRGLILVAAAISTGFAILLVRVNVAAALAVFAGAKVTIVGSGLTAAAIASILCLTAASAEFANQLNLKGREAHT